MSLQELVNNFGKEKKFSDTEKNEIKKLTEILDSRFNILKSYLFENEIYTSGHLKSLNSSEYAKLKSDISKLPSVGDEKSRLFLDKLDEIRNTKYLDNNKFVVNYGCIGDVNKWHIEVNHLKLDEKEFIDIRKIGPDGNRAKGIYLKLEEAQQLMLILKHCFEEQDLEKENLLSKIFNKNKQRKITNEMVHASYEYGKKVVNNELSVEEAMNFLNLEFFMNKSSARMYINSLCSMVNGVVYTRKTSIYAVEYYLNNIKKDFGINTYNLAILSVKKHIQWNRQFKHNDLVGLEKLINSLTI